MRTPRPVLPLLLWLVAIQSVFAFDEDSSFTIPYPSRDFTKIPEAVAQAKQSGFADYPEIVRRAAKKDSRALVRLFYIDSKTQWDAAGGELQNSVMRQMLLIWGDYDFAEALARQPVEIQRGVSSNFRMQPQDVHFAILFPRTAAIGDRVWPKRRGLTSRCSRRLAGLFPRLPMTKILPETAIRALASRG